MCSSHAAVSKVGQRLIITILSCGRRWRWRFEHRHNDDIHTIMRTGTRPTYTTYVLDRSAGGRVHKSSVAPRRGQFKTTPVRRTHPRPNQTRSWPLGVGGRGRDQLEIPSTTRPAAAAARVRRCKYRVTTVRVRLRAAGNSGTIILLNRPVRLISINSDGGFTRSRAIRLDTGRF